MPVKADLERKIAACFVAGDRARAVTWGLRGYGPELLGFMTSVLRDREAADDVFGAFSEQLWRSIGSFRQNCSFRTWAYRIAWHCLSRHRRTARRRRTRRLETAELSLIAAEARSVSSTFRHSLVEQRLERLRATLTREEQSLLVLRIDRRMPWSDVARVMGPGGSPQDEALLRKRFERLKQKLARAVASPARGVEA